MNHGPGHHLKLVARNRAFSVKINFTGNAAHWFGDHVSVVSVKCWVASVEWFYDLFIQIFDTTHAIGERKFAFHTLTPGSAHTQSTMILAQYGKDGAC